MSLLRYSLFIMSSLEPFHWVNGTHIAYGIGAIEALKKYIPKHSRVILLHCDDAVSKCGAKADIDKILTELKANYRWRGGIEPNPDYSTCLQIIKEIRKDPVDFIIPVGGGSVMDASKFIAGSVNLPPSIDPWDIIKNPGLITKPIPCISVCTLSATGSEWNERFVISRRSTKEKKPGASPQLYFKASILDPRYTLTVPAHYTANGLYDSFCHVMEQYITGHFAPMQDRLSEAVASSIVEVAPKLMKNLGNLNYRGTAMQTSAFALNTILAQGTVIDWATHRIGMSLTARYNMDHAETLVCVEPWLWRHFFEVKKHKLAQMAVRVWGHQGSGSVDELANYSISKTEEYAKSLGFGLKISDYAKNEKNEQAAVDWMTESTWELMGRKGFGERGMVKKDDVNEILSAAF